MKSEYFEIRKSGWLLGGKKMVVTKDMLIGDILDAAPSTAPFFLEMGMHCLGCPSARGESIADACEVHDVDVNVLIEKINQHLSGLK